MKYDYSQCNNLDWKTKSGSGFMKIDGNNVTLFSYKTTVESSNGNPCYSYLAFFHSFEKLEEAFPDIEITPRNPKSYNLFKTGDVVESRGGIGTIVFSTPLIVAVKWKNTSDVEWYSTDDYPFDLQLTDYEKELMTKSSKPKYSFKSGDKVIGRDRDCDDVWDFGIFEKMGDYYGVPIYICRFKEFTECVPFNEETYKLLGTVDNYGD